MDKSCARHRSTTLTFNDYDQLTKVETPLGHYVSFVVDKMGRQTEIKIPR